MIFERSGGEGVSRLRDYEWRRQAPLHPEAKPAARTPSDGTNLPASKRSEYDRSKIVIKSLRLRMHGSFTASAGSSWTVGPVRCASFGAPTVAEPSDRLTGSMSNTSARANDDLAATATEFRGVPSRAGDRRGLGRGLQAGRLAKATGAAAAGVGVPACCWRGGDCSEPARVRAAVSWRAQRAAWAGKGTNKLS